MADYYAQPVDFIGLRGLTLESPLYQEVGAGRITVGSNERPTLVAAGARCVKFHVQDSSTGDAIVDGTNLVGGRSRVSGGFAFSSLTMNAPADWGDFWTIGINIFHLGCASAPWGVVNIGDDLCRAYGGEHGMDHAHALEPGDISDPIARCIEIGNSQDYWCAWLWNRNGECRLSLYERWTGVLLGERVWTGADVPPAYLSLGLTGFDSNVVPYPQDFFMTDLVIDYTNALYPILDHIASYEVSFDSQGGSAVSPQTVEVGGLVTLPTPPTYEGHVFAGWYHDAHYDNPWVFASDTITATTTIYAKWNIVTYAVTFDSQGGSSVSGQTVNYAGYATEPSAPTRAHHIFGGWFEEAGCVNAWVFNSEQILTARTIYAKWTPILRTMSFNNGSGSTTDPMSIVEGSALGSLPASPTREGYTFAGWYTEEGGLGALITTSTIVSTNITVYANWSVYYDSYITIEYYKNAYHGKDPLDDNELGRYIIRAGEDLDIYSQGGIDETLMSAEELGILKKACAAQVEYYVMVGEAYNQTSDNASESIGSFSRSKKSGTTRSATALSPRAMAMMERLHLGYRGVDLLHETLEDEDE
jgi:uncharacterized repeat protein (TIGR02543 family)